MVMYVLHECTVTTEYIYNLAIIIYYVGPYVICISPVNPSTPHYAYAPE